ncbi:MAG: OmpW family outer membrane protein [Pseudomonadales bacterium]|jgi:outer membrane protein|nr:OmpW family outer membrane protein [Pseudomonadales bacterium]
MRVILTLATLAMLGTTVQTQAHEAGDFIIRGGIANVSPDASSSALILDGSAIGRSSADVDDDTQLGLTFTYMLTNDWAVDVLASTPFTHDISASTGDLGLGTIDAGKTTHLPPTVSLLYFPAASDSKFQPYFGAGLNYTLFFDEEVDSQLEGVLGRGSLELDPSFGLAVQAGFDYKLTENMYFNAGIWWIDIDTDAEFEFAANRITTEVEIDPFVYMIGLGWKF